MSKIKKILKSGTASRDEIARAINKQALKIAKKAGHSAVTSADYEQALLKDGAYEAYEAAPKDTQIAKSDSPTMKITKTESRIDDMANRLMKSEGLSYAQSVSRVLTENPHLYDSYEIEKRNAQTFDAKRKTSDLSRLRTAIDDDSDEEEEDEAGPVDTSERK